VTASVLAAGAGLAAGFDESKVTPGLAGFLVFAGLVLATWLLLRSFVRQLGRVRFDDGGEPPRRRVRPGPQPDAPTEARRVPPPRS
jgi:hypothetical protein